MAVMKIDNDKDYITGKSKYKDQNALQNVYQCIIDQKNSYKSRKIQSHYIGGAHVDLSDPAKSMDDVATKFHKASGIRLKHIIISFAEDEFVSPYMAAHAAEGISQKIGQIYQNFYVVHEDRASPHIHMMMNTVSHINGYKYQPQKDKFWLSDIVTDTVHELGIVQFRVYGR